MLRDVRDYARVIADFNWDGCQFCKHQRDKGLCRPLADKGIQLLEVAMDIESVLCRAFEEDFERMVLHGDTEGAEVTQ